MANKNRLRHINGNNLNELELILEKRVPDCHVIGVNRAQNGEWYIHFVLPNDVYFNALNDPEELTKLNELENRSKNGRKTMEIPSRKSRI